jgi:hypothetical protein
MQCHIFLFLEYSVFFPYGALIFLFNYQADVAYFVYTVYEVY